MRCGLRIVEAPAGEPVSLAEAKLHCRVDLTAEDPRIASLLRAARHQVERLTGRQLLTARCEATFDCFAPRLLLPRAPLASVQSVAYVPPSLAGLTMVPAEDYGVRTDCAPGAVYLRPGRAWPSPAAQEAAVVVAYTAGYGAAGDVPAPLREAILLLVGHWFLNREAAVVGASVAELPLGVAALLSTYRLPEAG